MGAEDTDEESKKLASPVAPTRRPRLLSLAKDSRRGAPQEEAILAAVKIEVEVVEVGHVSIAAATLL